MRNSRRMGCPAHPQPGDPAGPGPANCSLLFAVVASFALRSLVRCIRCASMSFCFCLWNCHRSRFRDQTSKMSMTHPFRLWNVRFRHVVDCSSGSTQATDSKIGQSGLSRNGLPGCIFVFESCSSAVRSSESVSSARLPAPSMFSTISWPSLVLNCRSSLCLHHLWDDLYSENSVLLVIHLTLTFLKDRYRICPGRNYISLCFVCRCFIVFSFCLCVSYCFNSYWLFLIINYLIKLIKLKNNK